MNQSGRFSRVTFRDYYYCDYFGAVSTATTAALVATTASTLVDACDWPVEVVEKAHFWTLNRRAEVRHRGPRTHAQSHKGHQRHQGHALTRAHTHVLAPALARCSLVRALFLSLVSRVCVCVCVPRPTFLSWHLPIMAPSYYGRWRSC